MRRGLSSGGMAALAGLALLCSMGRALAQTTNYVVDRFDTADEASMWQRWWGSAPQTYDFDPSMDASNNANSGSLMATVDFDLASYGGDNQFAAVRYFTAADGSSVTLDGSLYSSLSFDLRFETNSPTSGGNFGYFEYGLVPTDYSQIELGHVSVAATNGNWVHVVAPIDSSTPKITNVFGFWMKIWSGDPSSGMTGSTLFWVDNVELIANTNTAPPPPPQMTFEPVSPGLQLIASAAGQTYQRQSISTLSMDTNGNPTSYSWVGRTNPVTYSVTIDSYPGTNYSGFQTHLFLVPMASLPTWESSPDWNETNVVFLQIANNPDGSASADFRYKTNEPNGNTMYWNSDPTAGPVGTLAELTDPSPLGTWSLTFEHDTNVTLTAPSGASTNFVMPEASAALFADPLVAVFGAQPNSDANIGQRVVLGRVQVSGVDNPIDDHFTSAALDTNTWQVVAQDPAGVLIAPPNDLYWLHWSLPANGFVLQSSTNLTAGSWSDAGLTNTMQIGKGQDVLVPRTSLPAGKREFFRLIKP